MGQVVRNKQIGHFWNLVDDDLEGDFGMACDWIVRLLQLLTDDQMNDVLKIADEVIPMKPAEVPVICPKCGSDMYARGPVRIIEADGLWELKANQFDCDDGHTILLFDSEKMEDSE